MDNMEGQFGHENPLQLMSLAFGGDANNASLSCQDNPNYQYVMAAGRNQIPLVPLPLCRWLHCQQTSPSFVENMAQSSGTEISREMSYHNAGVAFGFKPADSSIGFDVRKVEDSAFFQEVKYPRPCNQGPMNNFTDAEYQLHAQGQESHDPHSIVAVGAPALSPKPSNRTSKRRATASATDRSRRMRIAERLDALHELLPHHKEGSKASLLDDIIDHVKYLQLQIKDLSRSRLGGKSPTDPFVFLEGYGHYLLHEQMLNEPLEEMMGKLLEVNPSAATQLLESRGLVIMPIDLAEVLPQPM